MGEFRGRIIEELLRNGRIARNRGRIKMKRQSRSPRPLATRGYLGLDVGLGDVVHLDTMTVEPHYGFTVKQFTAINVCSRFLVADLHERRGPAMRRRSWCRSSTACRSR